MQYSENALPHKRNLNSAIVQFGQFLAIEKDQRHHPLQVTTREPIDPQVRRVAAIMRRARVSPGHAAVVAELIAATTGRGRG